MVPKSPAVTAEAGELENAENIQVQFDQGIRTFSKLFSRWMDLNEWSHPVMTSLARCALGGASWLHSSQLSGFRQGRLHSPGPRALIGIERLNYYLHRYKTKKLLIPGTPSSNFYADPYVITENGEPPSLGWWVEVFCGYRIPQDVDLRETQFSDTQANKFTKEWGRLVRKLLTHAGYDIIEELEKAVREHYPARDDDRVARLLSVLRINAVWTADELALELPAIATMTASLGGPETEEALLAALT